MRKPPFTALGATLVALCVAVMANAAPPADVSGVDASIRPPDDFYGYANSLWIKATPLPDGTPRLDTASLLRAENARRVQRLIEQAAEATAIRGHPVRPLIRKVADYYVSRLDTAAIDARGLAPLSGDLAAIAAIGDRKALAAWLGRTLSLDDGTNQQTESLWGVWVHQDFHDPNHYAAHIVQGGLGLADRDDYLDPDRAARRALYRAHIAKVLEFAGFDQPDARAARVLALELAIAATHASRADTDDVYKTDNGWNRADFAAKAPGIDWPIYFSVAGMDAAKSFVVWQPSALTGGAKLVASQPLDAWKDYLSFHRIDHYAEVLPRAIRDEHRAFAATVSGTSPSPAQMAVAATESALGEAVGRLYVERYFRPGAKAAADAMLGNIRLAFRTRLSGSPWMSPATTSRALAKLAALKVELGYPATWIDYAPLRIVRGDAFGNAERAEAFARRRELARLGHPVDPREWAGQLYPQTGGAILNISPNTMDFAAGLLQRPYFDPSGDAAANYGSAGAGIAHEIDHSFDALGSQYDARGRLVRWWAQGDAARFDLAAAPLAAQLDACSPAPGLHAHGKQILAESAADLVGLEVAHDAWLLSLHGKPAPTINGLTGEQRFFVAFAQRWRRVQTDAALRRQVETDSHAPPVCRSDLVRNSDAWARAFKVKAGDRLYLASDARVHL